MGVLTKKGYNPLNMQKKYQLEYASSRIQMYDKKTREVKGWRIIKLLEIYYGKERLKELSLLDVGSSTGIIDNILAKKIGKVVGIDIDNSAIKFANKTYKRKNLIFKVDDALKLSFKDNSFDVIVCTHVYEHVTNPKKLFSEIYRVLKPEGVCYLAAVNKWWPLEPHHNLLLLSYLPKKLGNLYVKIFNKAPSYFETLYSYNKLSRLSVKFRKHEYTDKIFRDLKKYGYEGKYISNPLIKLFCFILSPLMRYTSPTFFWLLEKPGKR